MTNPYRYARAAVISACYGGYDTLKPTTQLTQLPGALPIQWVYVTDNEALYRGDQDPMGWTIHYEPRPDEHPNRAAKIPKLFPLNYVEATVTVWVDASYRVVHPSLVVDLAPLATPIAQFVHPWRDCAYDEASASIDIPKYKGEPIAAQAIDLLQQRMPVHWGLWATGVIARYHSNDPVPDPTGEMCLEWGRLIRRWSFQDQVSQPLALWKHNLRPTSIPGTHLANPWLAYEGSANH